jgi:competence protein ComEA
LLSNPFLAPQRLKAENDSVHPRNSWLRLLAFFAVAFVALGNPVPSLANPLAQQPPTGPKSIPPPEARVDINHASLEELLKVPGMTPSWAGRIVRFRPYRTKQDLLEHGVLPSAVYDRIKEYVIAHREKQ